MLVAPCWNVVNCHHFAESLAAANPASLAMTEDVVFDKLQPSIALKMSTKSPVASHLTSLLSQSAQNSSEDLPSSSISDEETQFLGQDKERDDIEKSEILPSHNEKKQESRTQFFIWFVINTLATIGIVRARNGHVNGTDRGRSSRTRPYSQTLSFA